MPPPSSPEGSGARAPARSAGSARCAEMLRRSELTSEGGSPGSASRSSAREMAAALPRTSAPSCDCFCASRKVSFAARMAESEATSEDEARASRPMTVDARASRETSCAATLCAPPVSSSGRPTTAATVADRCASSSTDGAPFFPMAPSDPPSALPSPSDGAVWRSSTPSICSRAAAASPYATPPPPAPRAPSAPAASAALASASAFSRAARAAHTCAASSGGAEAACASARCNAPLSICAIGRTSSGARVRPAAIAPSPSATMATMVQLPAGRIAEAVNEAVRPVSAVAETACAHASSPAALSSSAPSTNPPPSPLPPCAGGRARAPPPFSAAR